MPRRISSRKRHRLDLAATKRTASRTACTPWCAPARSRCATRTTPSPRTR